MPPQPRGQRQELPGCGCAEGAALNLWIIYIGQRVLPTNPYWNLMLNKACLLDRGWEEGFGFSSWHGIVLLYGARAWLPLLTHGSKWTHCHSSWDLPKADRIQNLICTDFSDFSKLRFSLAQRIAMDLVLDCWRRAVYCPSIELFWWRRKKSSSFLYILKGS